MHQLSYQMGKNSFSAVHATTYSAAYIQRDPSAHGSLFILESIYLTKSQINKSHYACWMLQHQRAMKWSVDLAIWVNALVMCQIW